MAEGPVTWVNTDKSCRFISPNDGAGQRVSCESQQGPRVLCAKGVRAL
jgi:cold shock CspA family protein